MEEKVKGIVLGGINYGENDKILTLLTVETGVISTRIKGVKKAGAKLKFASEPFCFAEYVLLKTGNNRTVKGASLIDSFYPVRENIVKFYSACTVADFAKRMFRTGVDGAQAFLSTAEALTQIAYGDEEPKSVVVKFLLNGIVKAGYGLNLNSCLKCGCKDMKRPFFDYDRGGFICENCFDGHGREINALTLKALRLAEEGIALEKEEADLGLRLINYYLVCITQEKMPSLAELLKI